jgi:hypothetical protein
MGFDGRAFHIWMSCHSYFDNTEKRVKFAAQ